MAEDLKDAIAENADGLSAVAAHSAEVRQILRDRARYEIGSNSYAKGIVTTLANYLVGPGPRLQLQTASRGLNRWVERSGPLGTGWSSWPSSCVPW